MAKRKINIVRKTNYYIDNKGFLKGKWGGFRENPYLGMNGEKLYWIFYSKFSKDVLIDEYGNFYQKFPCSKYDCVLKLSDELFFMRKKIIDMA